MDLAQSIVDAAGGPSLLDLGLGSASASLGSAGSISDGAGSMFSSLLMVEAAQALGLKGFAGTAFTITGGALTKTVLDNLQVLAEAQGQGLELDAELIGVMFQDFNPATFLAGVGNAIGGAFGDYLSSQLVAPNGEIAAIAGQITSTIGGWLGMDVGIALGGPIGGIVGDFIGSFLGDILGTLFGDLFGDNGPPTASVTLGTQNGQLGTINMTSDNGGTAGAFTPIATAVGNIVNSLIGMTGAQLTLASDVTFSQSGSQVGVTIPGVGYEALPTSGYTRLPGPRRPRTASWQ